MRGRKVAPAETLTQARNWEVVKGKYMAWGLCEVCAAQAAWAHQDGADSWETIHPPCGGCVAVVAGFPDPTPSAVWRKVKRPLNPVPGTSTPRNASVDNREAFRGVNDASAVAVVA
jgi:hypothetical protein